MRLRSNRKGLFNFILLLLIVFNHKNVVAESLGVLSFNSDVLPNTCTVRDINKSLNLGNIDRFDPRIHQGVPVEFSRVTFNLTDCASSITSAVMTVQYTESDYGNLPGQGEMKNNGTARYIYGYLRNPLLIPSSNFLQEDIVNPGTKLTAGVTDGKADFVLGVDLMGNDDHFYYVESGTVNYTVYVSFEFI